MWDSNCRVEISPWLDELTGKKTRKTYWQATCETCNGFIAASITRDPKSIPSSARTSAAYHRLICR